MIDPTAFLAQGAVVAGNVSLGKEPSIWYNTVVRGDMAPVRIGDQTNIQNLSIVHVDEGTSCIIGHRVSVEHRVILQGCTVDDECLIGMGAILLNGVHLGTGSVVGAGIRPESVAFGPVRSPDSILKRARQIPAIHKRHIRRAAPWGYP
jgi:carbonic anhydrase/acetyltransferase-like protein (isoleucine patch superfamily)